MSIQSIDNFELSVPKPIDNRIVVGTNFFYTDKDVIPLPYEGMRIYDLNDSTPYVWKSATWSYDIDRIAINDENSSTGIHYISFISATSGVSQVKVSGQKLRYRPSSGQIILNNGSAAAPSLAFTSSLATSYNTGIYRSSALSMAFSVSGIKYFELGNTTATFSNRVAIAASSLGTGYGQGNFRICNSSLVTFVETLNNAVYSGFRLHATSPTASYPGSPNTISNTPVAIYNYYNYSVLRTRDLHYMNVETNRGVFSFGADPNTGGNNDQFLFYMNSNTTGTSPFSSDNGGLLIQNNLIVGATSSLRFTYIQGLDNDDQKNALYIYSNNFANVAQLGWGGITSSSYYKINSGGGQSVFINDRVTVPNSGSITMKGTTGSIVSVDNSYKSHLSFYNTTDDNKSFVGSDTFYNLYGTGLSSFWTKSITVPNLCTVTVEVTWTSRIRTNIMGATIVSQSNKLIATYDINSFGVATQIGTDTIIHSVNSNGMTDAIYDGTIDYTSTPYVLDFYQPFSSAELNGFVFSSTVFYKISITEDSGSVIPAPSPSPPSPPVPPSPAPPAPAPTPGPTPL